MNLTNQCIFCDSSDNLNTSLTVKVNNQQHAVSVCDACEDRASPKAVKKIVEDRIEENSKEQKEIDKLRELASKHGLILVPDKDEIADLGLDQTKPSPAPASKAIVQKGKSPAAVPTKLVPQKAREGVDDVTPQVTIARDGVDASMGEAHSSYRVEGELRQVRKEDQEVKTESRGPIRIPSRILDNEGGRTTIRVNRTSDADLQRRFKSAAAADTSFREQGYQTKNCLACGGTGVSRVDKRQICPKCDGEGSII